MKKFLTGLIILGLAIFLLQCSGGESADQIKEVIRKQVPVKTVTLKPRPFAEYLNLTGTVKARNQIKIMIEESGILKKILKDKGQTVQAGDTLAILENEVLRASYKQAHAALKQAQIDFQSKKVLYAQKAISEIEYLSSKYALERAQAVLDLARARHKKLFITAPIPGFVNARYYDKGAFAIPATPIFDLIDNQTVKIEAGVAERFLSDISIGIPVKITFDAYPDMAIESTVKFVSQSIDPLTRTFKIEIEIPNPQRKLAPEMIANLQLLRHKYENRIVIPLDVLIESEKGRYVFVDSSGVARKVPVQLVSIYRDSVLVDGLKPNQNLVIVGHQELSDGDILLVQNEEPEMTQSKKFKN